MAGTAIAFNANDLQTATIATSTIRHHSAPELELSMATIANANKSTITNGEYPSKEIVITGWLIGTSISNMDTLEDTFKGYLVGTDKNLDIAHAGGTRRYLATPTKVVVDRDPGLSWGKFSVTFACSNPFGVETSSTNLLTDTTGNTSSPALFPIIVGGSAPWQKPIITVTITTLSDGANKTVAIGNDATGQAVSITRTWTNGDIIVINSENPSVTVNATETEFDGAIPEFVPGAGNVSYSDGFLSRSISVVVDYLKRSM